MTSAAPRVGTRLRVDAVDDLADDVGVLIEDVDVFSGDLDALAQLASVLADTEYGLIGFEEAKTDLEDLFLRVTKGEVR